MLTTTFTNLNLKMTTRPEYIRCIRHTHSEYKNKTWCDKTFSSFDWVFQDIDHATYTILDKSRLIPCPECISAIREVFKEVWWN